MLKIIYNDEITEEKKQQLLKAIKDNDGYCPCRLEKSAETLCVCESFKNLAEPGICLCMLFKKVES